MGPSPVSFAFIQDVLLAQSPAQPADPYAFLRIMGPMIVIMRCFISC